MEERIEMKKRYLTIFAVLLLAIPLLLSACTKPPVEPQKTTALATDAKLEIVGDDVNITLNAEEMAGLPQETFTTTTVSSSGEVSEVTVTGFSVNDLLAEHGVDLLEIASLNFVAADGYVMSAPAETYADTHVYVMLSRDGEDLEYPRSCIPEQRTMYWVKNLAKIELSPDGLATAGDKSQVTNIAIFREGIKDLEPTMLDNRGTQSASYSLMEYFEQFCRALPDKPVTMVAQDGFEKTETAEIFLESYVTLDPESEDKDDSPLYFSQETSMGMRVKHLDLVISGEDAVYFGSEISVADLFELVGMAEAESYRFVAGDGYVTEIPSDAIEFGTIYTDPEKGYMRAKFDGYDFGGAAGGGKVKYLVAIEAAN